MKKIFYILFAVFAMCMQSCSYNMLVSEQEKVNEAWSNVENQYQRRSDLIPNLVGTVKGYAKHEESTLTGVIEARAKATSINLNVDNLDDESLARFQKAQGELSSSLSKLMAVAEAYPTLQANQNFLELQAQLEGTENRITVARRNYNDVTRKYNTSIKSFPIVIYASWFGFKEKPYFKADEGSEKVPIVNFD